MGVFQVQAQGQVEEVPVAESGLLGELVLDEFFATAKSRTLRNEAEIDEIKALSAARVERAAGKGFIAPLTEAMPKLQMVIAGKDLPKQQHELEIGIEGLRFVPAHALLPQDGVVTLVNRQEIPIELSTSLERLERIKLAPGQRKSLAFKRGEHRVALMDFPHAVLDLTVLDKAIAINFDMETGKIDATPIAPGDYHLGFYLGARPLHIQPVSVPSEGALQIAATVSSNEIVTVSVTTGLIDLDDEGQENDGGLPEEPSPTLQPPNPSVQPNTAGGLPPNRNSLSQPTPTPSP
ncbi:MAG: hypothetical protein CMH56_10425 [Myxococcales bacterium]|nr:hypothetical protein [Myxococcales bacterium]|tara:strand:- start:1444 stop:2322 length:879 start_codon:yes stop_codon:yes gene_type:complete